MPEPDLCLLFVRPLNQLGARYLISGSVAAMLYGEPRLTHDVDFIVFLRQDEILRFGEIFPSPEFYLPPADAIAIEVARDLRGHFNVIHTDTGFKADFYTSGRDDLHAWAFRHGRRLQFRGEPVNVAPPEYVILRKLEYFREGRSEKHLRDIRAIMSVSGIELDTTELEKWIADRGLGTEWQSANSI